MLYRTVATWLLVILAGCMLAYGAFRGEMSMVERKAANICLECIGLG